MKVVGLIVEYNPFHNGHLYHIQQALQLSGADKVIVVMSGNFVQRGTPAIIPKHIRTEMALHSGVSLVIELPTRYATGSAEFFAYGAVELLHSLGCVDSICFGSECGNLTLLTEIAQILLEEPPAFQKVLQSSLKSGIAFPLAREKALLACLQSQEVLNIMRQPNNILAIEYIKSLLRLNSKITPFTILRQTSHYHDSDLRTEYSSASAIRNVLQNTDTCNKMVQAQMPSTTWELLMTHANIRGVLYTNDFSLLLHHKLLLETEDSLLCYMDMTKELANRIINSRNKFVTIDQFTDLIKSKNFTYSRVSRVLCHILLNITTFSFKSTSEKSSYTPDFFNHYIRVLGFKREDTILLNMIKNKGALPIITKLAAIDSISQVGQNLLAEDINAANLYESVVTHKFQTPFIHEYKQSIIIL